MSGRRPRTPPDRREFTKWLAVAVGSPLLLPRALAMAAKPEFQGIHRAQGTVTVNGRKAAVGTPVSPGDRIATGPDGTAIFVIGKDAFLLRAKGEVTTGGTGQSLSHLRIQSGRLLSVFEPRPGVRRIETATAVAGIRGTGIYIESEPDRSYLCTCYGAVQIASVGDPSIREDVVTTHHEAPRFVYRKGSRSDTKVIEAATEVINHTDAELEMLEWLVGRNPPFDGSSRY